MSKAMAIDSIMKLFLMVAVIIVGMSFLLKAFGIDLFGWLLDKFQDFDVPKDGDALHIALDETGPELWEFHLTDGEKALNYKDDAKFGKGDTHLVHPTNMGSLSEGYFFFENKPPNMCLLFLTNEEGGRGVTDKGSIFLIQPGATIDTECEGGNLYGCIKNYLDQTFYGCNTLVLRDGFDVFSENGCQFEGACLPMPTTNKFRCEEETRQQKEGKCSEIGSVKSSAYSYSNYYTVRSGAVACSMRESGRALPQEGDLSQEKILNIPFQSDISKAGDSCKRNTCNLLLSGKEKPHKDGEDNYHYEVKYGLICDDNGKWRVCKSDDTNEASIYGQSVGCSRDGDVYTWDRSDMEAALRTLPKPPTLTLTGFNQQTDSEQTFQDINMPISLIVKARDVNSDLRYVTLNLDDQVDKRGKCEFVSSKELSADKRTATHVCSQGENSNCEASWDITCMQGGAYVFQGSAVDSSGSPVRNSVTITYGGGMTLYRDANYKGESLTVSSDTEDLRFATASSAKLTVGTSGVLYIGTEYRGPYVVLNSDTQNFASSSVCVNDMVRSAKVVPASSAPPLRCLSSNEPCVLPTPGSLPSTDRIVINPNPGYWKFTLNNQRFTQITASYITGTSSPACEGRLQVGTTVGGNDICDAEGKDSCRKTLNSGTYYIKVSCKSGCGVATVGLS